MAMALNTREVDYTDPQGRKYKVMIPSNAPDSEARMGVVIGPPDLSVLNLPERIEIRLNNELFHRGLVTRKNIRTRPNEVFAALQAALRVDVAAIISLYEG